VRSDVARTQKRIAAGSSLMLLNGLEVDINDFDLYGALCVCVCVHVRVCVCACVCPCVCVCTCVA